MKIDDDVPAFMSATPGPYELERTGGEIVEQIIRPTGLVDPLLHVRPALGQVKDLEKEIRIRADRKERTLVTTLTWNGRSPGSRETQKGYRASSSDEIDFANRRTCLSA